jgi:signal transduction histidine kinase
MLSAVSHELRTPLTSVVGFALTLKERWQGLDDARRDETIRHLAEQSLKLERLLTDLLDLDRLRYGRAQLALERVDVGELVARVAAAHTANGRVVDVRGAPVVAEVDPAKVERIVENLLANALKHTPPGTTVSVTVSGNGDGVVIRVADDGPGIPDADKASVFELFTRGSSAPSHAPGTGIGLALVAQFAGLHGGDVRVEDNARGGATFTVHLPAPNGA